MVPRGCKCPITKAIMRDPVVAADGHTYEKSAIEVWFAAGNNKSPMTNETLAHKFLLPNYNTKQTIAEYCERNKITLPPIKFEIPNKNTQLPLEQDIPTVEKKKPKEPEILTPPVKSQARENATGQNESKKPSYSFRWNSPYLLYPSIIGGILLIGWVLTSRGGSKTSAPFSWKEAASMLGGAALATGSAISLIFKNVAEGKRHKTGNKEEEKRGYRENKQLGTDIFFKFYEKAEIEVCKKYKIHPLETDSELRFRLGKENYEQLIKVETKKLVEEENKFRRNFMPQFSTT